MSKSKKKKKSSDQPIIEQVPLITLTDEDGYETDFEYLDTISYKDKEYCVLYPNVDSDDEDYIILEVIEDPNSDEATYQNVPDARIMNKVFEIFKNS